MIFVWDNRPIGVIDSGVGGLTVAKELRNVLPEENIIYFGDNKNVPYGNKSEEEIYLLTKDMIDFLIKKDVKLIAVACNTISTIVDKYFKDYSIPIISIISPVVNYIIEKGIKEVGVLATSFTIKVGLHEKLLKQKDSDIIVVPEGSASLASKIDSGEYTKKEIKNLVNVHIGNMLDKRDLKDIVLGCTHFPIVIDEFKKRSPDINFIDPAYQQVLYVDNLMKSNGIKGNNINSSFNIYTTGREKTYKKMIDIIDMENPNKIFELGKEASRLILV